VFLDGIDGEIGGDLGIGAVNQGGDDGILLAFQRCINRVNVAIGVVGRSSN